LPLSSHPDRRATGIAAGPSGLLVVDVDNKDGKDGSGNLEFLQALYEPLPRTLASRTASTGRHLFFRGASRNSVCRLGDGLDVRSVGGYVVAPGPGSSVAANTPGSKTRRSRRHRPG